MRQEEGLWVPPGTVTLPRPVTFVNGDEPQAHGIRTTISIEQKINLGDYQSASVSIILSGIPSGASEEAIEEPLDTGKIAYDRMRERLVARVRAVKAAHGFAHEYGP